MSNYWLHRISYEWEVSYPLLEKGYLSMGWGYVSCQEALDMIHENRFDDFCKEKGIIKDRARWVIWYFANFKVGDIVVVPRFSGQFGIFKVLETAKPIEKFDIPRFNIENNRIVEQDSDGKLVIKSENEEYHVDLGFLCKVEPIIDYISRKMYADNPLTARMKIRQTTANICDISTHIEETINNVKNNKPINFYENAAEELAVALLNRIKNDLNPDKMEKLVKRYFEKIGATYVDIPAKNESGKTDGADADVIAVFKHIKVVFYVQVKEHHDQTSSWATEQIWKYFEQKSNSEDDFTYIPWVISTAENFEESDINIKKAAEKNVYIRRINGIEFAKMLLDIGLMDLDDLS